MCCVFKCSVLCSDTTRYLSVWLYRYFITNRSIYSKLWLRIIFRFQWKIQNFNRSTLLKLRYNFLIEYFHNAMWERLTIFLKITKTNLYIIVCDKIFSYQGKLRLLLTSYFWLGIVLQHDKIYSYNVDFRCIFCRKKFIILIFKAYYVDY